MGRGAVKAIVGAILSALGAHLSEREAVHVPGVGLILLDDGVGDALRAGDVRAVTLRWQQAGEPVPRWLQAAPKEEA